VIPIIAADLESDPVGSGFVATLAHPGGNITGVFSDFPEFGMKWLQLLKEAIPKLSSIVVLWDPNTGSVQLDAVKAAGHILNVKLEVIEIRAIAEVEHGLAISVVRGEAKVVGKGSKRRDRPQADADERSRRDRIPPALGQ
jgi:putative tryptophan/tyrosine transport system substrate-binding protein